MPNMGIDDLLLIMKEAMRMKYITNSDAMTWLFFLIYL